MNEAADQVARVAGMFDSFASSYDQSGTPFFTPIAAGLVAQLAPAPGERALDIGCGRGAATFRLAEAVTPSGRVDAIDVAPGMVERTAAEARERGLDQVHVRLDDASSPTLAPGEYDLACASLVLFFLPDPEAALRQWLAAVRPGGRLGLATFQPWHQSWRDLEAVFREYGDDGRDGRPQVDRSAFDTDAGVEALVQKAGGVEVRTVSRTLEVPFRDAEQWRAFSLASPMRGWWNTVPDERHEEVFARIRREFDPAGSGFSLEVSPRYTLCRAPG